MIGFLTELDVALFIFLNTKLTHPILDTVMPFITEQEHWYPALLGLWLALIIWGGKRGRMAAVALVIAVALSDQLTAGLIKPLVGRLRPCTALPAAHCRLLVGRSTAFSFPSAHAANSFAMATVVSWRISRFAALFFLIAAAVAYSRVYVGVHYPVDIIAGAVLGALLGRLAIWVVAAVADKVGRWFEVRGMDRKKPAEEV